MSTETSLSSSALGRTAPASIADETSLRWTSYATSRNGLAAFSVARALVPPLVAFELRDQLAEHLRGYSEWSMPEGTDDG